MHSSITHDAPEALSRQKQRNVIGERQSPIINFYPSQIDSPFDLALLFRNVFFWQLASTVYPILSIMLLSASHVPSLKFWDICYSLIFGLNNALFHDFNFYFLLCLLMLHLTHICVHNLFSFSSPLPRSNSPIFFFTSLGDRGEAIFKGRIRIPQHAQLTDSDQICRTIMLGDRARIIAMPTLEITADNVVCRWVVSQSFSQYVRSSVNQSVSHSVSQSVSQSHSQSVRQSVRPFVSQLVTQSVIYFVRHSVSQVSEFFYNHWFLAMVYWSLKKQKKLNSPIFCPHL